VTAGDEREKLMPREHRVPILNFHGIGEPVRPMDPPDEINVWLDTEDFASLIERVAHVPRVEITFDDGNKSDVDIALPILLEHGLTATFLPIVAKLGEPGYLSEGDVRLLVRSGMTVGTHGMHHRSWRRLCEADAHEELVIARDRLEQLTGRPVTSAACPFGQYDRRTLARLRRAQYHTVFTSDGDWADSRRWLQPRMTIGRGAQATEVMTSLVAQPSVIMSAARLAKRTVKQWR
jgi:peptidoglycan/xylan/chitin deacetylase (PgdA/CDA1 family)